MEYDIVDMNFNSLRKEKIKISLPSHPRFLELDVLFVVGEVSNGRHTFPLRNFLSLSRFVGIRGIVKTFPRN